jgi:hypothetical protein
MTRSHYFDNPLLFLLFHSRPDKSKCVTVNFIDREGDQITTHAKIGENLLNVAIDNDIDLEGTV